MMTMMTKALDALKIVSRGGAEAVACGMGQGQADMAKRGGNSCYSGPELSMRLMREFQNIRHTSRPQSICEF